MDYIMDFFSNFDWLLLLKCFVTGGIICVIGQILIDKTKLTPARILVIYVTCRRYFRRSWHISIFG